MLRAFLKDSAIYTVPAFISRGLSLLLVPLYTRVLSPADYGSLDLLMIFANLVSLTVGMEVSQGVARFYAGESDEIRKCQYASSAFWFVFGAYTLFAIFAFIYSGILATWVLGREGLETLFQIGVIYTWLNGLFYLVQNQLRWELRSKQYATASLLVAIVTACTAVMLAYGLRWGFRGLLWGMVAGVAVGVIYGLCHLRQSFRFLFVFDRLKEMLAFSAPLVPSSIAVFISAYVDRMMINHFLSVDEVGLYGIGFRLASVVSLVMVGFRGALTPLVYKYHRESDTPSQLATIFRLFLTFVLLIYIGLTLFADDILILMTTPEYYGASQVVLYLVPAVLLSQMYIFAPGIGIAKKTHIILWINLCGAILNTLLNWWFIPLLGISGAALATLMGYGCTFSAYMISSQRLYYVPHDWLRIATAVLSILAVITLMKVMAPHGALRWLMIMVSFFSAFLAILATRLLRFSEISSLRQLVIEKFSRQT
jgi:O-antigen/teichoic acid export membrane protein